VALIALGVTGGIGAYKAVEVARGLQTRGHDVVAIMTASATRFVGPVTFEAITRRRVITDQFEPGANADIEHIALASTIDLLLIAPATANVIGKLAHGLADNFLTTLYTATRAPVLIAPAMNTQMFEHDAVRRNLDTLAASGVRFVEPGEGYLACGWIGKGRLAEPEDIVAAADAILRPAGPLRGQRVLVTAGPTFEDVDPVRFIGNRSSGRMGFALATEAVRRGAQVTLVAGPTAIDPPAAGTVVRVRGAAQMHQAVIDRIAEVDVVIMAAAVADYMPAERAAQKVSKTGDTLTLVLTKTPDILGDLGKRRLASGEGPLLVGFAAETEDVVPRAIVKRREKHADLIVANDVSRADAGFDVGTNAVTLVSADRTETLPLQSKAHVAAAILDRVEDLMSKGRRVRLPSHHDSAVADAPADRRSRGGGN
jgi:phosphopantothenoylcysteine decarboxylase/phosphopantothenate--cysteine ligase